MDKVVVRTKALSQALFSLVVAGCETVEVSVVAHAVKVEGIKDDERVVLHVWSKDAEDTEASVGKGEQLTEEEIKLLDAGKCPKCQEQLAKGPKEGLAINVSCDNGHLFWVPVQPFIPEYRGQPIVEEEEAKAEAEQAKAVSEVEAEAEAEGEAEADGSAEEAIKALEEEPDEASNPK